MTQHCPPSPISKACTAPPKSSALGTKPLILLGDHTIHPMATDTHLIRQMQSFHVPQPRSLHYCGTAPEPGQLLSCHTSALWLCSPHLMVTLRGRFSRETAASIPLHVFTLLPPPSSWGLLCSFTSCPRAALSITVSEAVSKNSDYAAHCLSGQTFI